jgi:hypothetical protein
MEKLSEVELKSAIIKRFLLSFPVLDPEFEKKSKEGWKIYNSCFKKIEGNHVFLKEKAIEILKRR